MTATVRLLLTAMVCEKGDVDGNLAEHLRLLEAGAAAGCHAVVFPEFSLTGYVEPLTAPERAVVADHPAVAAVVEATRTTGVAAIFGLGERAGPDLFITQVAAVGGAVVARQRKRYLGEGEEAFAAAGDTAVFDLGEIRTGIVICAEAGVDWTWDATVAAGATLVLFCSAPGLYGRCTDEASWREGFAWWDGCGMGDARTQAARLAIWVAMATQAGSTVDEDFPGVAALVSPAGEVVARLPDWRAGTLVVDVPVIGRG